MNDNHPDVPSSEHYSVDPATSEHLFSASVPSEPKAASTPVPPMSTRYSTPESLKNIAPPPKRRIPTMLFILIFVLGMLTIPWVAEQTAYSINRGKERAKAEVARQLLNEKDVEQRIPWVAKAVAPSVVGVRTIAPTREGGVGMEIGSGVIVEVKDDEAYVLTNDHVVANAPYVMIQMNDGRIIDKAEVIGRDEATDLAVIRVEEANLTAIEWGDSREIEVGDQVLAVGNPFGLSQTVTSGIISATEQYNPMPSKSRVREFLQTDAAINPGNSGGPLVDMNGKLIGINTAIFTQTGGSLGIGFAIPSIIARRVYEDIQRHGEVKHGWLGIYMKPVTPAQAKDWGLGALKGVVVDKFLTRSPAQEAGMQIGDVILKWGDTEILDPLHLSHLIVLAKPGDKETVEILRNGERIKLDVTLGTRTVDLQ